MAIKQWLNGVAKEPVKRSHSYPSGAIPPKLCETCGKAWDYTNYTDADREGDDWDYLENFPTRGCDREQCPQCKPQVGGSRPSSDTH